MGQFPSIKILKSSYTDYNLILPHLKEFNQKYKSQKFFILMENNMVMEAFFPSVIYDAQTPILSGI